MKRGLKVGLIITALVVLVVFSINIGSQMANSRQHELVGTKIPYQGKTLVVWSASEYDDDRFCLDATWEDVNP